MAGSSQVLAFPVSRAGVSGILKLEVVTEPKAARSKRGDSALQVQQAIVVTNAAPFPLSPPAFENLCGKSTNAKWKQSLKLANQQHVSVGRMMEEQQLEGPSSHQAAVSRDRLARDVYSMTEMQALTMARTAVAQANPGTAGEPAYQLPALPGSYLAVRLAEAGEGPMLTVMQLLEFTILDRAVAVTLDKQVAHTVRLRNPAAQPCTEGADYFVLTPAFPYRFTPNTASSIGSRVPAASPPVRTVMVKSEPRASLEEAYSVVEASGDSQGADRSGSGGGRMRRKRSLPEPSSQRTSAPGSWDAQHSVMVERAPSWESSWTSTGGVAGAGLAPPAAGPTSRSRAPGATADPLARLALVAAELFGTSDDVSATGEGVAAPSSPCHALNSGSDVDERPAKRPSVSAPTEEGMLPCVLPPPIALDTGAPVADDSAACGSPACSPPAAPADNASGNTTPRRLGSSSSGSVRTGLLPDATVVAPSGAVQQAAAVPTQTPAAQPTSVPTPGLPSGLPVNPEHLMLLLVDRHMRIAELEQQLQLHSTALVQLAGMARAAPGAGPAELGGELAGTVAALTQALAAQRQAGADLMAAHTALLVRCEALQTERDTAVQLLRAHVQAVQPPQQTAVPVQQ